MKKLFIIATTLIIASCASPNSEMGRAIVFDTIEPITVTSNDKGSKVGEACGKNVLGVVTMGDLSIEKARENGNISSITSVDKKVTGHIFIADVCTIVRGN